MGPLGYRLSIEFTDIKPNEDIRIEEISGLDMPTLCSYDSCGKHTAILCGQAKHVSNVLVAGDSVSLRLDRDVSRLRMVTIHIYDGKGKSVVNLNFIKYQ